ncbi:AI-2E family transporter [Microcoleus sp. LEGE 07076]|uniref:AI-2E family transporter n=1 Tax=Microcoleus sp. LEGE 07076 TaxID=915322 RepID=UPI00187F0707|nr:AI-2E family transporter [Microcoleus sp. LEGE 07076]MBE9187719.1 AI-2E family transporter [Microcoleus sp. LEGE 07076]
MRRFNQLSYWWTYGLLFPLTVLNCWLALLVFEYFRALITVLVIATVFSFLLDYPVRFLRRYGLARDRAVLSVLLLTLLVLVVLTITLAPILLNQITELATRLPTWIVSGTQQIEMFHKWAENRNLRIDVSGLTAQLSDRLSAQLQSLTGEILKFGLGAADSAVNFLLTIVLTFYLLLHGDHLWEGLFKWFPSKLSLQLRLLLARSFHNYFVGQATLAGLMGLSMTVAFLILRVPFGLLFGLGVGVMTMIPFGAPFSICIVSLLILLNNFWLGVTVLVVATVIDQVIESGVAPRLLGGFIGLNPVWILVSLLIGVKVAGLAGLIVAVPMAGFIKNAVDTWETSRNKSREFDALHSIEPAEQ